MSVRHTYIHLSNMDIYIYAYIYTRVSMHKYTFIRIYMYTYLHKAILRATMGRAIQGERDIHVCTLQMHIYTYIHIYANAHVYIYTHIRIHMCIHNKIYIHTRIRIHTQQFTGPAIGRTIPGQGDTHVYMLQMYIYTHVQMYISKCIHI